MGMDDERPDVMPRAEQKRILIKKYNRENWLLIRSLRDGDDI